MLEGLDNAVVRGSWSSLLSNRWHYLLEGILYGATRHCHTLDTLSVWPGGYEGSLGNALRLMDCY